MACAMSASAGTTDMPAANATPSSRRRSEGVDVASRRRRHAVVPLAKASSKGRSPAPLRPIVDRPTSTSEASGILWPALAHFDPLGLNLSDNRPKAWEGYE